MGVPEERLDEIRQRLMDKQEAEAKKDLPSIRDETPARAPLYSPKEIKRIRRSVKVCFSVACKVTACNIKRWAKAHADSRHFLKRLLSTVLDRLMNFITDLIEISSILRISRTFI